ncbi:MAG: hypothetical protein RL490_130 [Pseudomonadota bacterium]
MTDPVILRVDPGTSNHRLSRIHEALRDLDLELCGSCSIWKPVARILWEDVETAEAPPYFASVRCKDCAQPLPSLSREGPGVGAPQQGGITTVITAAQ